ncbi:MAG: ketoacyl-ACP synthase III [Candidatus Delongbacteria bacterium]|jgi:3-oxoacyl-[acyl-carrier-protein] synthase-3|nr:ketoacyl-ACP synthase III [Candidatus Delongbacteria bacterium]
MAKKPTLKIVGTGSFLPETILTNKDLEKVMDTTDEWITQRVGIKERRIIGDTGLSTSDMATEAGKAAIEDAGLTAEDIDCIIVATITPDMHFPSTAIFVQQNLGAKNAAVFDVSAACTGWIYGMTIAEGLILSGKFKNILVIGAEFLTSLADINDRSTYVLFGDASGAVVVQPADGDRGMLGSYIKSNGDLADLLWSYGGGSRTNKKVSDQEIMVDKNGNDKRSIIRMEGNKVYKYAVRAMIESAEKAMEDAQINEEDIDMLIPHQANSRIIDAIAKRVKLPDDKVVRNLQYLGNTSSASIPVALDQVRKDGRLKDGDVLLVAAFGGGFTWGGLVIKM